MKNQLSDRFKHIKKELTQLVNDAPEIMGVIAVEFFKLNFEKEGTVKNGQINKWKGRINGTPRNDRKTLSDTNHLEDSIRYKVGGSNWVSVGVDLDKVPYAQIHNEGGEIAITEKMRKYFWAQYYESADEFWKHMALTKKTAFVIPKREFMVITDDLKKSIGREITSKVNDIMKS